MTIYKVYVRGHGGDEAQVLPRSQELPIDLITVGQYGCTMSGAVADKIIAAHWGFDDIRAAITKQQLIYWTHDERANYYSQQRPPGKFAFTAPSLERHPFSTLSQNLVLQGAADIGGDCGVCYWNAAKSELTWLRRLKDKEDMPLSEILNLLHGCLQTPEDAIELYWTACLSADHWQGSKKAVSFMPT